MLDLENALGENRNCCRVVSYNTMCDVNDSHMLYTQSKLQYTEYSRICILLYQEPCTALNSANNGKKDPAIRRGTYAHYS